MEAIHKFDLEINSVSFNVEIYITDKNDSDLFYTNNIRLFESAENNIRWFCNINSQLPIQGINFCLIDAGDEERYFEIDKQGCIYDYYEDLITIWLEEI